jgi:hypothetical protein
MPRFASDPAPQQLTAPCRKYSGRLHSPIEQAVYPAFFLTFLELPAVSSTEIVLRITFLKIPPADDLWRQMAALRLRFSNL